MTYEQRQRQALEVKGRAVTPPMVGMTTTCFKTMWVSKTPPVDMQQSIRSSTESVNNTDSH